MKDFSVSGSEKLIRILLLIIFIIMLPILCYLFYLGMISINMPPSIVQDKFVFEEERFQWETLQAHPIILNCIVIGFIIAVILFTAIMILRRKEKKQEK